MQLDPSKAPEHFQNFQYPGAPFEAARQGLWIPFGELNIDMNLAGDVVYNIAGDFLYVDSDPTNSTGVATLQLNTQQDVPSARFYIQPGFALGATFKQIRVTWSAQTGKKMRLLYSTGERVVPANTALTTITGWTATQQVSVSEFGIANTVTNFVNNGTMLANTALQVFAAGSNTNGAVIAALTGMSVNGTGVTSYSALAKATAPANTADGIAIASGVCQAISGAPAAVNMVLARQRRLASGVGLFLITSIAETVSMKSCDYTLL